MFPCVDLLNSLCDPPIGIDHISDSLCILRRWLVAGAVSHPNLSTGVAQQFEREVKLLSEGEVFFDGVKAHAKYLGVLGGVFLDSITESFTLGRSARGVGLWIKPQDDGLASLRGQANILSSVGADGELGRHLSNFEHAGSSYSNCRIGCRR
jgi:hypothetical protein